MKKRKMILPLLLLVLIFSVFPASQAWAKNNLQFGTNTRGANALVYKTGYFNIVMKVNGNSTKYRVTATASSTDANASHSVSWSMKLISGTDLGYTIKSKTNSLYDGATGYYVFEAVFEGGIPGYKLTWNEEETQFFDNGLYSEIEESSNFSIRVDTNDLGCTNFQTGAFHNTTLVYDFTPKSYNQVLQVRYEKADGTWGAYKTVINKSYKTGAVITWNKDGSEYDTTIYQKQIVSYTCPGKAYTKKVSIYRNTYPVAVSAGTGISSVSGGKTYRYGESCTISAQVKTGYHWGKWTGSATSTKQSYTFTVKEKKNFVANAVINQSTLSVNPNGGTWNGSMRSQNFVQNYNTTMAIPDPVVQNYTAVFNAVGGTIRDGGGNTVARIVTNKAFSSWSQTGNAGSLSGKVFTFGAVDGGIGTLTAVYTGSYTVTPPKDVVLPGYDFQGWYTAAVGGTKIAGTVTLTADTTFYAQWKPKTLRVHYEANGGTGIMADDTVSYGSKYLLRENGFTREGYQFLGWGIRNDMEDACYQPGEAVDGTWKAEDYGENQCVTFYAIWKQNLVVLYNGGEGAKGDTIYDAGPEGNGYFVDEQTLITLYDNLETGTGEDHFTKEETVIAFVSESTGEEIKQTRTGKVAGWTKGGEEDTRLYQKGSQETAAGLYDGAGEVEFTAVWDMGPTIKCYDLYYSLQEAQSGYITEEELLSQAAAVDEVVRVDSSGNIVRDTIELNAGMDETAGTTFVVWDYAATDFINLQYNGSVSETFYAEDSVGNVTKYKIIVHVADTTARDTYPSKGTVRFISEKYYSWTMAEDSVWVKDNEYASELIKCLANERVEQELSDPVSLLPESMRVVKPGSGSWKEEPEQVWHFSHEDVLRVQEYVSEHGIGNTQEEDGLKNFLEEFRNNRIK